MWRDADGAPMQAHGGGVVRTEDEGGAWFYLYGEDKGAPNARDASAMGRPMKRIDALGVRAYRSRDLALWEPLGRVLPASDEPGHDLHPSGVVERPKVARDPATGLYVMRLHVDTADYLAARQGTAVAERPEGPFRYLGSERPGGFESRDQTMAEADGALVVLFSSDGNATLRIARLGPAYAAEAPVAAACVGESREAPAPFRALGAWRMFTSGCTGWNPNPARAHAAPSPFGPWTSGGNPCRGANGAQGPDVTFGGQIGHVFEAAPERWVAIVDHWVPEDLQSSGLSFLEVGWEAGEPILPWRDEWRGLGDPAPKHAAP